jgi:hypothetical protein
LTIWAEPEDEDGKPSVDFVGPTHSPVVMSKTKEVRYVVLGPGANIIDKFRLVSFYGAAFERVLAIAKFQRRAKAYASIIEETEVPPKYTLDLESMKVAAIIGSLELDDLPPALKQKLSSSSPRATETSPIRFTESR